MTKKNEEEKTEEIKGVMIDPKKPPIWVDVFNLSLRDDGIALLRLVTTLPEGAIEQAKIITNEESLKELIDELCTVLNYFPEKAQIKKQEQVIEKKKSSSKKKQ